MSSRHPRLLCTGKHTPHTHTHTHTHTHSPQGGGNGVREMREAGAHGLVGGRGGGLSLSQLSNSVVGLDKIQSSPLTCSHLLFFPFPFSHPPSHTTSFPFSLIKKQPDSPPTSKTQPTQLLRVAPALACGGCTMWPPPHNGLLTWTQLYKRSEKLGRKSVRTSPLLAHIHTRARAAHVSVV